MKKILYILLLLIAIPVNAEVTSKQITLDSTWTNASKATTTSGSAILYTPSEKNNVTIAINPYTQAFSLSNGTTASQANLTFANAVRDNLLTEGYQVLMLNSAGLDDIARIVIANNTADIYIGIEHENSSEAKGMACKYLKSGNAQLTNNTTGINNKSKELCSDILTNLKSSGVTLENQTGERDAMNNEIKYSEIPATSLIVGDSLSSLSGTTFASNTTLIANGIINYTKEIEKDSSSGVNTQVKEEVKFDDANLTEEAKKILEEVSKSWPSNISKGRVDLIKKAASLYGKTTYKYSKGHGDGEILNANPKELDCSAFVSWAFYHSGYGVGENTAVGFISNTENFEIVSKNSDFSSIEPGDIIVKKGSASSTGNYNHVVIYIGKDSTGQMRTVECAGGSIKKVYFGKVDTSYKFILRYKKWPDETYSNSNSSSSSNSKMENGSTSDKYKNIFAPLATSEVDVHCDSILYFDGEKTALKKFLDVIYVIIKLSVPVITVVLSILEYSKSLLDPNNADGKKVTKRLITRIAIGIIIFLLPDILELLFHTFGLYDLSLCTGPGFGD